MKLNKKMFIVAVAGTIGAASAVPAMAFENEFHGMYRAFGFVTNALSGATGFHMQANSETEKYIEQRARLMYIAKANKDVKLVTHFEIDTKFGGLSNGKYPTGDGGGLDADKISLETKNVYLDLNIPSTTINAKIGIQPYTDSLNLLYSLFDGTGAVFTGKFGNVTAKYGYFTVGNVNTTFAYNSTPTALTTGTGFPSNNGTKDLNVLDLQYAVNKDLTVGASYYMLLDKVGNGTVANNTIGLNSTGQFGPATVTAVLGFQFGKSNPSTSPSYGNPLLTSNGTTAMAAAVDAKIAVGPGKINAAALYLSGDKNGTGHNKGWQSLGSGINYYKPANMWLITRNIAMINSSTAIGGTPDLARNGRGILGFFGGYEGENGKLYYNANVGYAKVAQKQAAASASVGTELNATIGYKLYDSVTASFTAAYAILGDGYGKSNAVLLDGTTQSTKYDNPFLTALQINYAF